MRDALTKATVGAVLAVGIYYAAHALGAGPHLAAGLAAGFGSYAAMVGVRRLKERSRVTREAVLAATATWGSGFEVARRLGTRHYAAVYRTLHTLLAAGMVAERWTADGRRQYRARRAEDAA